jgi:kynureninase
LNAGWGLPADAARGYVFAATIGIENWRHYLAYVDGSPAGVSVLFVHDKMADCFLSATLVAYRGRGAQTALIERRLADGVAMGCDLATSQTVVTNASPRNMTRQGFTPLYRRWIYGKRLRR